MFVDDTKAGSFVTSESRDGAESLNNGQIEGELTDDPCYLGLGNGR